MWYDTGLMNKKTDSLPILQFANLAQHERPLICSCTETLLKSGFLKVITMSLLQYRGRREKRTSEKEMK